MDRLINYEKLDKLVKAFEDLYLTYNLDLDEQKLLLDILVDRRLQQYTNLKTNDYLGNIKGGLLGGLFKKTQKTLDDKEESDF